MPTFIFSYNNILAIHMPIRGEYITDPHPAGHNAGTTVATNNVQITPFAKELIRGMKMMGSKPLASEVHRVPVFQLNRHSGADSLMYGRSSITVLNLGSSKIILGRANELTLPYGSDLSVLDDMEEATDYIYPRGFMEQMVRMDRGIADLMERQHAAGLKPDMDKAREVAEDLGKEARAGHKFMDLGATKDELRALQLNVTDGNPAPVLVHKGEGIRPRTDPFSDTSTQPIRHYKGEPLKVVSELVEARGVYMSYNDSHLGSNCAKSVSVVQDAPGHNALCLVRVGHPDAINVLLSDDEVEMLYQGLDRFRRRSK